jgi:hypothetical protein
MTLIQQSKGTANVLEALGGQMFRYAAALLFATTLSSCAQPRPLDSSAKDRLRTVAVISIVDLPYIDVATRSLPSEVTDVTLFGLGIDRTHFDAAMRGQGLHLARTLQDMVLGELQKEGYQTTPIDMPHTNAAPIDFRQVIREKGIQTDAVLGLRFIAQGYIACSDSSARLAPNVNVSARLIDTRTSEPLYEEGLTYGCKVQAGIHQDPSLVADNRYVFASYEALTMNPALAAEGLRDGITKISSLVGRALAK